MVLVKNWPFFHLYLLGNIGHEIVVYDILERGSNPVEALTFFRLLLYNCLNWKIYCDNHSSLSSTTAVKKWIISYTSHHFTPQGRYELNKLTSLPICAFIAQLVEQRTSNVEVTGSNPVKALIFFQPSSFQLLKLENLLR